MPVSPALAAAWQQADFLTAQGDLRGAREVLEPAAEVAIMAYGPDHPDVIETQRRLALAYRDSGDWSGARRALEEALAGGLVRFGDADPMMLALSAELGGVAEQLGNRHEARRNYARVVQFGPQALGHDHPYVRAAQAYLGGENSAPVYVPPPRPAQVEPPPRPGPPPRWPLEAAVSPPARLQPSSATPASAQAPAEASAHASAEAPAAAPAQSSPTHIPPEQPADQPTWIAAQRDPAVPRSDQRDPAAHWAGPSQPGIADPPAPIWPADLDLAPPAAAPPHRTHPTPIPTSSPWQDAPPPAVASGPPAATAPDQSPAAASGPPAPHAPLPPTRLPLSQTIPPSPAVTPPAAPGPQQPAPQHQVPQQPAPQHQVPQQPAPQHQVPQQPAPQQPAPVPPPPTAPASHRPVLVPREDPGVWRREQVPGPPGPAYGGPPVLHATEPRRSHTALIVLAVFAAVALVAASAIAVLVFVVPARNPASSGNGAAASPASPSVAVLHPPTDVSLRDDGSSITLTWKDPGAGALPFIVSGGRAGEQSHPYPPLPPGQTTFTINGLNATVDYCFTVVAVYTTDEFAPSNLVCTRRAATPRSTRSSSKGR